MFGWIARFLDRRLTLGANAKAIDARHVPGISPVLGAPAQPAWSDTPLKPKPAWLARLPPSFAVLDVETTGLHSHDRIVSLGALFLESASILTPTGNLRLMHLIFDPGKKCHPAAARVHGYHEWTLRHQAFFSEHAQAVYDFLEGADVVVAHNADFDIGFVNREFAAAGLPSISKPSFCTMNAYRDRSARRASLATVSRAIGLSRSGFQHGALEDAWLTMQIYLWLHGAPMPMSFLSQVPAEQRRPSNLRPVPPAPSGVLPARKRRPRARRQIDGSSSVTVIHPRRPGPRVPADSIDG